MQGVGEQLVCYGGGMGGRRPRKEAPPWLASIRAQVNS